MRGKQVLYQNADTGAAWDVTSLVSAPKWETKRKGGPAAFKFTALPSVVAWTLGGVVCFLAGGKGYFYGYIFKLQHKADGMVEVTAYDQLRYLKNKDTYVFEGRRADEVVREIGEDFRLKLGELANTGYAIPAMSEDNKTLLDIISKALDYTLVNTGQLYCLWDDYGALRLSRVLDRRLDLFLGDGSGVLDYGYETDIDGESYNQIKLVRDNKESGGRDVYLFRDSGAINRWGLLQLFEKVDEKMNAAQISARGDMLLELKNRPGKALSIDGVSDLAVRGGCAVYVQIAALGLAQYFVVEEASHDLEAGTMQLKVKVV